MQENLTHVPELDAVEAAALTVWQACPPDEFDPRIVLSFLIAKCIRVDPGMSLRDFSDASLLFMLRSGLSVDDLDMPRC